jgi:hypothetical protein
LIASSPFAITWPVAIGTAIAFPDSFPIGSSFAPRWIGFRLITPALFAFRRFPCRAILSVTWTIGSWPPFPLAPFPLARELEVLDEFVLGNRSIPFFAGAAEQAFQHRTNSLGRFVDCQFAVAVGIQPSKHLTRFRTHSDHQSTKLFKSQLLLA